MKKVLALALTFILILTTSAYALAENEPSGAYAFVQDTNTTVVTFYSDHTGAIAFINSLASGIVYTTWKVNGSKVSIHLEAGKMTREGLGFEITIEEQTKELSYKNGSLYWDSTLMTKIN